MTESEKHRGVVAEATVKAWKDEAYRARLLDDPAGVLQDAGLELPAGCKVTMLENTGGVVHVAIPRLEDMAAGEKEWFMAELDRMIPAPAGLELRLHQNSDEELFLVLPQSPHQMEELSDEELVTVWGGGNGGAGAYGFVGTDWIKSGGFGGNGGAGGRGGAAGSDTMDTNWPPWYAAD